MEVIQEILNKYAQLFLKEPFDLKVEPTDDGEVLIVDKQFLIAYDGKKYFVQRIVHFPGTYYDPPDTDYKDIGDDRSPEIACEILLYSMVRDQVTIVSEILQSEHEEKIMKENENG